MFPSCGNVAKLTPHFLANGLGKLDCSAKRYERTVWQTVFQSCVHFSANPWVRTMCHICPAVGLQWKFWFVMQQEINNLKWKNKCSLTSMIFWSIKRKMHFSLFCYESFFWPNLLIVKVSFGQMDHCHHHLAVVLQCAAKILIQATINHSVFKMKRTNVHWSQWSSVPFNLTNACPFLMIKFFWQHQHWKVIFSF